MKNWNIQLCILTAARARYVLPNCLALSYSIANIPSQARTHVRTISIGTITTVLVSHTIVTCSRALVIICTESNETKRQKARLTIFRPRKKTAFPTQWLKSTELVFSFSKETADFLFEFWPRTFNIRLYEKRPGRWEILILILASMLGSHARSYDFVPTCTSRQLPPAASHQQFVTARGWCQTLWLGFGWNWLAISQKSTSLNRRQYS